MIMAETNTVTSIERLNAVQTGLLIRQWETIRTDEDLPLWPDADESLVFMRAHTPVGWIVQFEDGCAVAEGPIPAFFITTFLAGRGT